MQTLNECCIITIWIFFQRKNDNCVAKLFVPTKNLSHLNMLVGPYHTCSFYSITFISLWVTVSPYEWFPSRCCRCLLMSHEQLIFSLNRSARCQNVAGIFNISQKGQRLEKSPTHEAHFWRQGLISHTGCADVPNGVTNNTLHFQFLNTMCKWNRKRVQKHVFLHMQQKNFDNFPCFGVHMWSI